MSYLMWMYIIRYRPVHMCVCLLLKCNILLMQCIWINCISECQNCLAPSNSIMAPIIRCLCLKILSSCILMSLHLYYFEGPYIPELLGDFSWVIFTLGLLFLYHWLPLQILAMVNMDCNVKEHLYSSAEDCAQALLLGSLWVGVFGLFGDFVWEYGGSRSTAYHRIKGTF